MVIAIRKNELFDRIRERVLGTSHTLPATGTGAPGMLLEQLLGVDSNSSDLPDAGGWEIKFHGGTALLTLCHKTPKPGGAIKALIDQHGWTGSDGRRSFRHTISGGPTPRGFSVVDKDGCLHISHAEGPEVYWRHDDIINAVASKLRRLVLVCGRRAGGKVFFESAFAYSDFTITKFIPAAVSGKVKVDFDARYSNGQRDAGAIRDHGTKFRIKVGDLAKIYESVSEIRKYK